MTQDKVIVDGRATGYKMNVNEDGSIDINNKDNFYLEITKGNVPGHKYALLSGKNPGINQGSRVDIWSMANEVPEINFPSSDVTMFVSSTDATDIGQLIMVAGLDADYNEQSGIAITNGQNQVEVKDMLGNPITFLRFFTMQNLGPTNLLGELFIAETDTLTLGKPDTLSTIYSKIFIGDDRSFDSMYTIPAGKTGNATLVNFAVGRGHDAELNTFLQFEGGVRLLANSFPIFQQFVAPPIMPAIPSLVPEKVDIWFGTKVNNDNTSVTARADILLIEVDVI